MILQIFKGACDLMSFKTDF